MDPEKKKTATVLAPFLRESLGVVGVVSGGFVGAYGAFSSLIGPVSSVLPTRPFVQVSLTTVPAVLASVAVAGACQALLPRVAEAILLAANVKPTTRPSHSELSRYSKWATRGADFAQTTTSGETPLSAILHIEPFRQPTSKDVEAASSVLGAGTLAFSAYILLRDCKYRIGKMAEKRIGRTALGVAILSGGYTGLFLGPTFFNAVLDLFYFSNRMTDSFCDKLSPKSDE